MYKNVSGIMRCVIRTGVVDADWVDELVEEASGTSPPLENSNTLGPGAVGEQLDEESCGDVSDHLVG